MYSVALIQNQSEMAHYGYADARPLLKELNYKTVLYTADNIDDLSRDLSRKNYDAVIFASNALNDKTIMSIAMSEDFKCVLEKSLRDGVGLLILHQLKLAQSESSYLSFLPKPLSELKAVVRPLKEKSADGSIEYYRSSKDNIILLYPNNVDPDEIKQRALGYKSLRGLYWHYWDNINFSEWDTLLVDNSYDAETRYILLSTKESSDNRIIISSLTLDWQKQRSLLANLLTYVVEGHHNTAVLTDEKKSDTAFDYLISTIESRKFPFQKYFIGDNLDYLNKNLVNGVHTTLLLGPYIDLPFKDVNINSTVKSLVASGQLKLITIEKENTDFRKFSLSGRERFAFRLLQKIELMIQAELRDGYIDGSFWSTAETLQIIESLKHKTANYKDVIKRALKIAAGRDRDGSYDEVFGVSCALYWVRAFYMGKDSEGSKATDLWIREHIENYEIREQALAYTTFSDLNAISLEDKEKLISILTHLSIEVLSEIDLIVFLKAALSINYFKIIPALVNELNDRQNNDGAWVDLATTATAASLLIDSIDTLKNNNPLYNKIKPLVDNMIFKSIIYIQNNYEDSEQNKNINTYPWDGKASTTVKCLQAWLKFDDLLDLPVYEIVEAISRYNIQSNITSSGKKALTLLEDMKLENKSLIENNKELSKYKQQYKKLNKSKRIQSIACIFVLYSIVTILVGINSTYHIEGLKKIFQVCVIDAWGYHLTMLLAAITSAVAIFIPEIRRKWGVTTGDD